jgi:hypothetical protein
VVAHLQTNGRGGDYAIPRSRDLQFGGKGARVQGCKDMALSLHHWLKDPKSFVDRKMGRVVKPPFQPPERHVRVGQRDDRFHVESQSGNP